LLSTLLVSALLLYKD